MKTLTSSDKDHNQPPLFAIASQSSLALRYSAWDDTSMLINPSGGIIPVQDEYDLHGFEGIHVSDTGSKEAGRISNISSSGIGNSSREMPSSELANQEEEGFILHGTIRVLFGNMINIEDL
ncbi:hypothetical protein L6452_09319 [Arctium lappa]|uniref:Uncharacterized protein n=1 Tax=Arctium lappa TaxID=4217 RepID=A0ACB9DKR0_ARCLA|nr:hypothetical protein L6452_09319 [Arctium lappa]